MLILILKIHDDISIDYFSIDSNNSKWLTMEKIYFTQSLLIFFRVKQLQKISIDGFQIYKFCQLLHEYKEKYLSEIFFSFQNISQNLDIFISYTISNLHYTLRSEYQQGI
ncbi:hypothetical protein pb186bvf_020079 [Paramecium bursaria]